MEYPCAQVRRAKSAEWRVHHPLPGYSNRYRSSLFHWQGNRNNGSASGPIFRSDEIRVSLDDSLADRKSQAGAGDIVGSLHSIEFIEDAR